MRKKKVRIFIEDGVVMSVQGDSASADWLRDNLSIELVDFDSDTGDRNLYDKLMQDSAMKGINILKINSCE